MVTGEQTDKDVEEVYRNDGKGRGCYPLQNVLLESEELALTPRQRCTRITPLGESCLICVMVVSLDT